MTFEKGNRGYVQDCPSFIPEPPLTWHREMKPKQNGGLTEQADLSSMLPKRLESVKQGTRMERAHRVGVGWASSFLAASWTAHAQDKTSLGLEVTCHGVNSDRRAHTELGDYGILAQNMDRSCRVRKDMP